MTADSDKCLDVVRDENEAVCPECKRSSLWSDCAPVERERVLHFEIEIGWDLVGRWVKLLHSRSRFKLACVYQQLQLFFCQACFRLFGEGDRCDASHQEPYQPPRVHQLFFEHFLWLVCFLAEEYTHGAQLADDTLQ